MRSAVDTRLVQQLLAMVRDALLQGHIPLQPATSPVQLHASSLIECLLEGDAARQGSPRPRPDYASELQPALASDCPLAGVLADLSLLFARRNQTHVLRQQLLSEQRVLAVVNLPHGLLRHSGIGLCLILLVPPGTADTVTLLDASITDAGFAESGPTKRQRVLIDVDRLATTLVQGNGAWWVTRLPANAPALMENLDPRGQLMSPLQREIENYFAHGEFKLGNVVDYIPPAPSTVASDARIPVQVVNPSDLPHLGFVQGANGERHLSSAIAQRRPHIFLHAGDLLVSCTRTSGIRIAVVPHTAPMPGAGGWIAARTVCVYRPRTDSPYDARALAVMLASPLGMHLLDAMLHGRGHVTPRLLLELRLPAMDKTTATDAVALFDQHLRYEHDIRELRQSQAALRHQLWPLQADENETRTTP